MSYWDIYHLQSVIGCIVYYEVVLITQKDFLLLKISIDMSQMRLSFQRANLIKDRLKSHNQHEGEIYVQKRRHAPPDTHTIIPQMIEDDMPDQHSEFFTYLSYFSISTLDAQGRPWATIVVGAPTTLVRAVSQMQLNVSAVLSPGDPFMSSVIETSDATCRYFAGLGVDFSNRRRNKVAGLIAQSNVEGNTLKMSLITNENLGNCPKYITLRKLEYHERHPQIGAHYPNTEKVPLSEECQGIINRASTIFLATRHTSKGSNDTSDLGLNHRGGSPGFVRYYEEDGNTFIVVPDYSGNRFYQSLGNIQTDQVAGVVFPCFITGDMLYITGIAQNIYDDQAEQLMPRVTLITRIKLTGHVWIKEAMNLRLLAPEQYSPYNPPVRYLVSELKQMGRPATPKNSRAILVDVKKMTKNSSRFTFQLEDKVLFKPGGFIILDFSHLIPRRYRHMNEQNPQAVNDDYVRTWTISSSPPFNQTTHAFEPTDTISCTIKHVPRGVISSLLHSYSMDEQSPLSIKFVGVGGDFTCFNEMNIVPDKILFIAGGIGCTPFLSMHQGLSQTKQKVDIVVLFACRGDEINLLNDFISSPIVSNISIFDTTDLHSSINSKSIQTHNRRMKFEDIIHVSNLNERHVYLCGPGQFMTDTTSWLEQSGVKSHQINKESFLF